MNLGKRLIVFGGGALPKSGLKTFLDWSRAADHPRLLVITWASEEAAITADFLSETLLQFGPISIDFSLEAPVDAKTRAVFHDQLASATGVFFSGGDQNRIATALEDIGVHRALHERYAGGLAFAGTSAGTAIMSNLMFAGDHDPGALDSGKVRLREGLGLCGGVIIDQHFLKRQRQNRLFAAVLRHPDLIGIGVDEGTALAITDGRVATVVGPEKVMRVEKRPSSRSLSVDLFHEGEEFDLFSGLFAEAGAAS